MKCEGGRDYWPKMTSEGSSAEALQWCERRGGAASDVMLELVLRSERLGNRLAIAIRLLTCQCAWLPPRSWSCRRTAGPAAARRTCEQSVTVLKRRISEEQRCKVRVRGQADRMLSIVLSLIMQLYLEKALPRSGDKKAEQHTWPPLSPETDADPPSVQLFVHLHS